LSAPIFVKLGGSVITDKNHEATAFPDVLHALAREIAAARAARSDLALVLGHGSGSFGHFVGRRYQTHLGLRGSGGWEGYVQTAAAAARLNRIVTDIFLREDLPVVSIQPSASALCRSGEIISLDPRPIRTLLESGCVPLVYGDVALDTAQGFCIISTEVIFAHLARCLSPERILLVGIVDGVHTADPFNNPTAALVPAITGENLAEVEALLGGSHGVDVTGGMLAKVREMHALAQAQPGLRIQILSGRQPGLLQDALLYSDKPIGTVIRA
jgi:isopentenyl phosphate kinase